jgi:hypothetical protein
MRLIDEKTEGQSSRSTVPLKESQLRQNNKSSPIVLCAYLTSANLGCKLPNLKIKYRMKQRWLFVGNFCFCFCGFVVP